MNFDKTNKNKIEKQFQDTSKKKEKNLRKNNAKRWCERYANDEANL